MEEKNNQVELILGKWWRPIRKWFYPAWLSYEISIRFYTYAQSVHIYVVAQQDYIASYIGEIGAPSLIVFCSVATFSICTFFLTAPSCFVLFKFFKTDNLTGTQFEEKIKKFF